MSFGGSAEQPRSLGLSFLLQPFGVSGEWHSHSVPSGGCWDHPGVIPRGLEGLLQQAGMAENKLMPTWSVA